MFAQSGQRWLAEWPSWTNLLSPGQCSSAVFQTSANSYRDYAGTDPCWQSGPMSHW